MDTNMRYFTTKKFNHYNKSNKTVLSLFCLTFSLLLLFSFLTVTPAVYGDENIPGTLVIDKAVVPNAGTDPDQNIWRWDVTVSLRGLDLITTSDIVLVIDTSTSMGSGSSSKMTYAKNAANEFVNKLLPMGNDGRTRIALVSFETSAHLRQSFTDSPTVLNTAINELSSSGSTHIQAGIEMAQDLLADSTATNKYIVLLGDGDPTYSYRTTAVTGVKITNETGNNANNRRAVWDFDIYSSAFSMTFGSTNVGSGTSFAIGNGQYNSGGVDANGVRIQYGTTGHWYLFPYDNGIPTIYQARLAKEENLEIYTIAVAAGTEGTRVLKECSSGSGYDYSISDSTSTELVKLSGIFGDIAGKILYAASQAKVTDPMGEYFTLIDGLTGVTVNKGTVNYDATTGTLTWDIGDVRGEDGLITMTYTVEIDVSKANADTLYQTNGDTVVTYIDVNGDPGEKHFISPTVGFPQIGSITKYIYFLNDLGQPLTEQGIVTTDKSLIPFNYTLKVENPNPISDDPYVFQYDTYTIAAEPTITVNGELYMLVSGNSVNLGDTSPVSVTVSPTNQHARVYFAYQKPVTLTFTSEDTSKGTIDGTDVNALELLGIYGDTLTPPTVTAKFGYQFKEWTPTDIPSTFPSSAATYTATWEESDDWVTVTFVNGDVSKGDLSGTTSFTGIKGASVPVITEPDKVPVYGYMFGSWNGTVPSVYPSEDMCLVGSWVENFDEWSTVTFVNSDVTKGSFVGDLVFRGIIGSTTPVIVAPIATPVFGYEFAGWDVAIPSVYPAANVTITGNWAGGVYNIFYDLQGGVNDPDNPSLYSVNGLPLRIMPPSRDGYVFVDWVVFYADGSVGRLSSGFIAVGTVGDVMLVAEWRHVDDDVLYSVVYNGNGHSRGLVPVDVD
ncbi:MAG: VWA domain-containing protein, partial [Candidatus Bathyarchaeota archaeon]|nr:VWA domain-containing protein [Candidatus Termiticorpusculum sp.]